MSDIAPGPAQNLRTMCGIIMFRRMGPMGGMHYIRQDGQPALVMPGDMLIVCDEPGHFQHINRTGSNTMPVQYAPQPKGVYPSDPFNCHKCK